MTRRLSRCVICTAPCLPTSANYRITCSDDCLREARRRDALTAIADGRVVPFPERRRKRSRWAETAREEISAGRGYYARLAKRWRIPETRVKQRLERLRFDGLLERPNRRGALPFAPGGTCRHGHPMNKENTYVRANGHRQCRRCRADGMKKRR